MARNVLLFSIGFLSIDDEADDDRNELKANHALRVDAFDSCHFCFNQAVSLTNEIDAYFFTLALSSKQT